MIDDEEEGHYLEVDPNEIVKGCVKCFFSIIEEVTKKGFWNFCPCCGTTLTIGPISDYHELVDTPDDDEFKGDGKFGLNV